MTSRRRRPIPDGTPFTANEPCDQSRTGRAEIRWSDSRVLCMTCYQESLKTIDPEQAYNLAKVR